MPQSRDSAVAGRRCRGMADSTHAKPSDMGLMVKAMAYRAKYRKINHGGKFQKVFLRIESLGVHKKNRGGPFFVGVRRKNLCVDAVESGFLEEEVNNACIAVEEIY